MSKHFAIVTAAALVAGAMGLNACAQDMNDQTVSRTEVQVSGNQTASVDRSQINRALSDTVASALNGDADISSHVTSSDRERLNSNMDQGRDQARQAAQRVREAFRAKYNQDFDLSQHQQMVFNDQFVQLRSDGSQQAGGRMNMRDGENARPQIPGGMAGQSIDTGTINQSREEAAKATARADARRTDDATARRSADAGDGVAGEMKVDDGGAAAEARTEPTRTNPEIPGGMAGQSIGPGNIGDADRTRSIDAEARVATDRMNADARDASAQDRMHVTIPASHGMATTHVPMVREGTDWKIDLPSALDGQRVNQNLAKHLNQAADSVNNWPADATEGYRAISHHVLMALTETR